MDPRTTRLLILAVSTALLSVGLLLTGCSPPTRAKVVSLEQRSLKAPGRTGSSYHRVKRGDTLYSIAWLYGLDLPELAAWNAIRPPYTIYPGQTLRLIPPARNLSGSKPEVNRLAATGRSGVVGKQAQAKSSSAETAKQATPKASPNQSTKRETSVSNGAAGGDRFDGRRRLVWQWPTRGKLEQRFAKSDPGRKGIKISGRNGQKVVAAESGKVVYAGSGLIGYGQLIIIKHNKNYLSAYGHNRKLLAKEGAVVRKGSPLAEMGRNGGGKPVLHFEIRRNGVPVDPIKLLPRR